MSNISFPPAWSTVYKNYKIIKKIGSGGMGTVFLVEKNNLERELYALKYRHIDNNENNYTRFLEELRLLKRVNSKNIPKIYDEHIDNQEQFFIMEYVQGKTLKKLIVDNVFLNTRIAVNYAKQIAAGISVLHSLNIIHRDIKSDNILISDTQIVKIIDLGISLDDNSQRITKANNIVCSAYYVAPELIENRSKITHSVDIYALGILLFEMLTGKYPFEGKKASQTVFMHKNSDMPDIMNFVEIPQSLANVIIIATAKDPQKRYSSMWDFRLDLDTCLSPSRLIEQPLSVKTIKPKITITEFINSWRFNVAAIFVIFVFLLGSLLAIVLLV